MTDSDHKTKPANRRIQPCGPDHAAEALDFIQDVFTTWNDAEEGATVRRLVEEIRGMPTYVPELERIMVDEQNQIIGYAMFSRFQIEGRYGDRLLLLSPVGVKTELQRQHISKELIEDGFHVARSLGFTAVLVEGNPQNYRARGFRTAADYGILAAESVHLPHIDCLMAAELVPGGLNGIHGVMDYACYKSLA